MNKKILIILICAVICSISFICAYTIQKGVEPSVNISASENASQGSIQGNTEQVQALNSGKGNDVIFTLDWKDSLCKRGKYVPIHYIAKNRGKNTVYHVSLSHPMFWDCHHYFGTLKSGESKKYTYMLYIPTDSDMEEDMPGSGPLPNPWEIGSFSITFKDASGGVHEATSNYVKIKWHN